MSNAQEQSATDESATGTPFIPGTSIKLSQEEWSKLLEKAEKQEAKREKARAARQKKLSTPKAFDPEVTTPELTDPGDTVAERDTGKIWQTTHFYTRRNDNFQNTCYDAKFQLERVSPNTTLIFAHDHEFGRPCSEGSKCKEIQ